VITPSTSASRWPVCHRQFRELTDVSHPKVEHPKLVELGDLA
jgi:hypothetical protein